jgi:hypothetical protein
MEQEYTSSRAAEISHTYAFLKSGASNRYLKYADTWGGFYVGFCGFPLDLVAHTYEESLETYPALREYRALFAPLRAIYRMSLPEWRSKVRLALWNREASSVEIWEATDTLQPFPRQFLPNLFDNCANVTDLGHSAEWRGELTQSYISNQVTASGPADYPKVLDYLAGPSGYRFLPARRLAAPIPSEVIYAPIDTLSVLQSLNRKTFCYMTDINPPAVPWPAGIFDEATVFISPNGAVVETGYGRFVREYLDDTIDPERASPIRSLNDSQRMTLICATLNPILVETAAMLFALDIGMVIDSGSGKGRQGIDVVAACGNKSSPELVIARLQGLGIALHSEALVSLKNTGTMSFQCKGYHSDVGLLAKRFIEFRPIAEDAPPGPMEYRRISLQQVLSLATRPEYSGLWHLNAWLGRMYDVVVKPRPTFAHRAQ